jgi:hypothetical protein
MRMICDGMTEPGYLRPLDEADTPLRFRYRTVSPMQRAEFNDMLRGIEKVADRELIAGKMVAKFVTEWDQRYPDKWPDQKLAGKAVPITPETCVHNIHPTIFTRLFNIVLGTAVPDPDPKESVEKQEETILKNAMKQNSLAVLLETEDQERLGN